jgi:hypothetical protein
MENPKPPVRALLITRSYATANTHIGSYRLCNKNLRRISQTVPKVYVKKMIKRITGKIKLGCDKNN